MFFYGLGVLVEPAIVLESFSRCSSMPDLALADFNPRSLDCLTLLVRLLGAFSCLAGCAGIFRDADHFDSGRRGSEPHP
jgi:hypothetical protein